MYAMYMCITFTHSCAFHLLSFQPCQNVLYCRVTVNVYVLKQLRLEKGRLLARIGEL